MGFVKGQKIQYIGEEIPLYNITVGGIYEFICCTNREWCNLFNDTGNIVAIHKSKFKTIIQSFDDVVIGMELTHRVRGRVKVCRKDYHEEVCYIANVSDGYMRCCTDLWFFEEYKPKEEEIKTMCEEYEVTKPFTLLDIWNAFRKEHSCSEFQREFGKLLKEFDDGEDNFWYFESYKDVATSSIFKRNLHHLEKKGLIKKKEKDVVLKPGMRLQECSFIWRVIEDQCGNLSLISEYNHLIFNFRDKPLWFREGMTLRQFNSKYTSDIKFEVVDET